MLHDVVALVYSAHHLLCAEVYRHKRQFVERSLRRLAPYSVGLLHAPVAERNDDVLELQALTLVYGDKANAVDRACLDGVRCEVLVPLLNEVVECGCV